MRAVLLRASEPDADACDPTEQMPRKAGVNRLHTSQTAMSAIYQFTIDGAYRPDTLPMERLSLYLGALAKLLGEQDKVHFEAVWPGSAVLVASIDEPARPKVRERAERVRDGTGPQDAAQAFAELDTLLRKDNAKGRLVGDSGGVVIPFPGRERPTPLVYGPFRQDGTFDGQVIRIGGKDVTVPVHLRDGEVVHTGLYTTPEIARRLAQHYLGPTLRLHGAGAWLRGEDGSWRLQSFRVNDFEVLDEAPLADIIAALRAVEGSGWGNAPDPVAELMADRHGVAH